MGSRGNPKAQPLRRLCGTFASVGRGVVIPTPAEHATPEYPFPVPDPAEVPTVSVPVGGSWFGLGRSPSYEAARRGELPVLRFNRTLRVPVARCRVLLGLDAPPEPDSPTAEVVSIRDAR